MDAAKKWLGNLFGCSDDDQYSWFNDWMKFDSTQLFSTVNVGVADNKHFEPLAWGVALMILGLIVLTFDTRASKQKKSYHIRDRILGLEQRHFLVIFNGLILYIALLFLNS